MHLKKKRKIDVMAETDKSDFNNQVDTKYCGFNN